MKKTCYLFVFRYRNTVGERQDLFAKLHIFVMGKINFSELRDEVLTWRVKVCLTWPLAEIDQKSEKRATTTHPASKFTSPHPFINCPKKEQREI